MKLYTEFSLQWIIKNQINANWPTILICNRKLGTKGAKVRTKGFVPALLQNGIRPEVASPSRLNADNK